MSSLSAANTALAYDALAPYYDDFTAGYDYDRWISEIEKRALAMGLGGRRALDVACGTGKSTQPLLDRGYSVRACDNSEGMIRQARRKFSGEGDAFLVADMRQLPDLGEFDLILCLDDAVNYLLSDQDLTQAFSSIAGCLSTSGVFVFDVNSLLVYRTMFASTVIRQDSDRFFAWQGEADPAFGAGDIASARIEIFARREDGAWERSFTRHTQRHHPPSSIRNALDIAGMRCCRVVGQRRGIELEEAVDEETQSKRLYFCRRT